jgi:hypothetical protein
MKIMKSLCLTTVLGSLLLATGCYQTQEGRLKAGMPFSSDTFEAKYERPLEEVYQAARKTLAYNGTITSENTVSRTITAKIDTRTVWMRVEQAEPMISRLLVQARNGGRADLPLAAELDKQTALNLKVMPTK